LDVLARPALEEVDGVDEGLLVELRDEIIVQITRGGKGCEGTEREIERLHERAEIARGRGNV
jgi:hypothetical protein